MSFFIAKNIVTILIHFFPLSGRVYTRSFDCQQIIQCFFKTFEAFIILDPL